MNDIKISSNRSFGLVFFIFFLILSTYPLLNEGELNKILFIVALFFLFLGLINSKILTPLNIIWFKFGIFLGKIVSPVVMGLIFFLVVTPIGLIMKIFKKDLLNLNYNNEKTYWVNKNNVKSSMKNQF